MDDVSWRVRAKAIRYRRDDARLAQSSSGGFFLGASEYVIGLGGIVYGAAYDVNNEVKHVGAWQAEQVASLQGSKYVQSNMGDTFTRIRSDLHEGRTVLFTGTPCQVAGLVSFLGREYDNLLTMDFACHGVPSPLFFQMYLWWLCRKTGRDIPQNEFVFRTKKYGWNHRGQMSYTMMVNGRTRFAEADPYYAHFLRGSNYRESCYRCAFRRANTGSDYTVGDFNGVREGYPSFMDRRGISYAILNTPKGEEHFRLFGGAFEAIDVDINFILEHNKSLTRSIPRPAIRDRFYCGISETSQYQYLDDVNKLLPWKSKIRPYVPSFIVRRMNVSRKVAPESCNEITSEVKESDVQTAQRWTDEQGFPILFREAHQCTGCTACQAVCSRGAVAMIPDYEGFLYPRVNSYVCVKCEQCLRACPLKHAVQDLSLRLLNHGPR
jgi:ferredoxin